MRMVSDAKVCAGIDVLGCAVRAYGYGCRSVWRLVIVGVVMIKSGGVSVSEVHGYIRIDATDDYLVCCRDGSKMSVALNAIDASRVENLLRSVLAAGGGDSIALSCLVVAECAITSIGTVRLLIPSNDFRVNSCYFTLTIEAAKELLALINEWLTNNVVSDSSDDYREDAELLDAAVTRANRAEAELHRLKKALLALAGGPDE